MPDAPLTPARPPRNYKLTRPAGNHAFDLAKALTLRLDKHLSYADIAKAMSVPESTLHRALAPLQKLIAQPELIAASRDHMPTLLDSAKLTLLRSMVSPAKVAKASVNNLAYALSRLDEVSRLERGQSTQNIGILSKVLVEAHADLPRRLRDQHTQVVENTVGDLPSVG